MLDEMANGKSPSDKQLYKDIYGGSGGYQSRSGSANSSSKTSTSSSNSDGGVAAALIGLAIASGVIYGIGKAIQNAFTKSGTNYQLRVINNTALPATLELSSYWSCGTFLGWHSGKWELKPGESKSLADKDGQLQICHIEKLEVESDDMSFLKRKLDIKGNSTIEIGNWGARVREP